MPLGNHHEGCGICIAYDGFQHVYIGSIYRAKQGCDKAKCDKTFGSTTDE